MNFEWDSEKNEQIKKDHEISFEEIVALIAKGCLVTTLDNPSPNYKGQKIFLVRKGKAIYMVPFERRQGKFRLITAFFSQNFTKKYME